MKTRFLISLQLCISISSMSLYAQDSIYTHQSARIEIGVGTGMVGEGGGFSGRFAFSYLHSKWGGVIRISAHDGGEGNNSGWFGPPKEKFYDNAVLLSYVITQSESWQIIASAGYGSLYGERLTNSKNDLEEFGRISGFAYELGIASAGSTLGWSLNFIGNINSESNLIAIFLSVTLGYQK
jgi:hypothetical protein